MRFENQTFEGDVTLDYNEFINCTFTPACLIHFGGGMYSFTNCKIAFRGISWHDNADRTLHFMRFLYAMPIGPEVVRQLLETGPTNPAPKMN